jgi:hypothetical protein
MKTLKQYRTEQEASIDSLVLKELGIEFTIFKNDGGPYPSLSDIYGYSICVNDSDYENALKGLSQNLNVEDKQNSVSLPPESLKSEPPGKKMYFYVGIIIGIFIGLSVYWAYLNVKFHTSSYPKVIYRDGWAISMIEDRNKDNKDDYWQKWDNSGNSHSKADNNFDGKYDYWWDELDDSKEIEKRDCDFNGIPDETTFYVHYIIRKKYFHPNNPKRVIKFQEYSSSGILETEYLDTDSIAGMNLMRTYNEFGTVLKETAIKDTVIQLE